MAKIKIPFNQWSKNRLVNQTKKATSRYKKYFLISPITNILYLYLHIVCFSTPSNVHDK